MNFRTPVTIAPPAFSIEPCERMLFVGSCFADSVGRRFQEEHFRAEVNPFGVMYNPASVLHTIERFDCTDLQTVFITMGTNHVYILNSTGEIVDNCQKRPQKLFTEKTLTVDECAGFLLRALRHLRSASPGVRVVLTVSPIRYRKYGYHESQLSKATLLLAADRVVRMSDEQVLYFPAYEIINDELRDYRFYASDMLHPSDQAVAYIWERLTECYLSDAARQFIQDWHPIKAALAHRPFNPEGEEYRLFRQKTLEKLENLRERYPDMPDCQCFLEFSDAENPQR